MKPFLIAALVALIATAASAQTTNFELAPIIKSSGNGNFREQPTEEPEVAILPRGIPAEAQKIQPNESEITTSTPSENLKSVEKSSTRLQVEAAATRISGPRFICRGTDPFWVLRIEQNGVAFDKAGEPSALYSPPDAAPSENSALAVTNFVAKNTKGEVLSALVVDTQLSGGVRCSDGMQDQEYTHSVFINRSSKIFDGCCWMER